MKRKISTMLVGLTLVSAVSCGGGGATSDTTVGGDTTVSGNTSVETGRADVSDELPAKNWNGREFRIYAADYLAADLVAEEENGNYINDAIYKRNRALEERFGIEFVTYCEVEQKGTSSLVSQNVLANDDFADIVLNHMIETANLASQQLFLDWNTVPYINTEKPWWLDNVTDNLSVQGKNYMIMGSISPYYTTYNYVVYFNKTKGEDYGVTDALYDTVLDGTWTIDKMASFVKDTYNDLSGNGERDENDFYGLAQQITSYATPYLYSFGEVTVKNDNDGIPKLNINEEKCASIVEKVYSLFYESDTITEPGWVLHRETFKAGRALFMNGVLNMSYNRFADMNDDFGILPMPKWDEEQEDYFTMSDGSAPLLAAPITAADTEFVGMITEALCAQTWKDVDPVIIDMALKVRGARDERSVEAIELALNGSVVDFGYVYGNYNSMGFLLSTLMGEKNNNFASYYASVKASWAEQLDTIIESYLN